MQLLFFLDTFSFCYQVSFQTWKLISPAGCLPMSGGPGSTSMYGAWVDDAGAVVVMTLMIRGS